MFADRNVRQAMTYAYDRETIVEFIRDGFGIVANAPMPQASWAFTEEGINDYAYNPEKAKKLLADAGWKPGRDGILEKDGQRFEFEFVYSEGTRQGEQEVLLFQQNLADIGIKVNLRPLEFSAAVDRIDAREFDMYALAWNLAVEPDTYSILYSTSPWNDPGFINTRSDELIDMGRVELDVNKRAEIYAEWQRLINSELPYIFISYGVEIASINERVQGIDTNPGPGGLFSFGADYLSTIWLKDLN